ncbi:MAG: thioredoxin domain-containing protein [Nanoarchaeota archaeon]|nr:hypothetical protein [Nanoarchaeota archaeon]MBU1631840.1 hypothetical protein [Nanoarchaeota archaeon]MBU1875998.1 hypothetical protein [Nanoarchaeota archaeon]
MKISHLDQEEYTDKEDKIYSDHENNEKILSNPEDYNQEKQHNNLEDHNQEKQQQKKQHKLKKLGFWQITSIVLGILLIISVFAGNFSWTKKDNLTGDTVADDSLTGDTVADNTINFINQNILQGEGTATLKEVKESNGLYNLKLNINGQEMDSYVTIDGKLLFPQAIDLTKKPQAASPTQQASSEIPNSDKPKVELFVMSYCPYGTQIEKGIIPVVNELGDKIDFEIKFVNYAMHGKKELDEELMEYCIQKEYNNKFIKYLSKFLENGDSKEALNYAGLTEADISSCIKETDEKYKITALFEDPQKSEWSGSFPPFKVYDEDNKKYGVQGSPTLVINGQQAQSGRDAQSILNLICGAFTNSPEECSTDMASFGNPAPGFGFNTQGGSATSAGCGV